MRLNLKKIFFSFSITSRLPMIFNHLLVPMRCMGTLLACDAGSGNTCNWMHQLLPSRSHVAHGNDKRLPADAFSLHPFRAVSVQAEALTLNAKRNRKSTHYRSPTKINAPQKKGLACPYLPFTASISLSVACRNACARFIEPAWRFL